MNWRAGFSRLLALAGLLMVRAVAADVHGSLAVSGMDMNYQEFSGSVVLDEEHGQLAGLQAALGRRDSGWSVDTDLTLHAGWADYSAPPAIRTDTHERILDWNARAGLPLVYKTTTHVDAYAGLGYRDWRRAIKSTTLAGLVEDYRWWYLLLGLRGEQYAGEHTRFSLDARLLRPVRPRLDVDFNAVYDDITVYPQARNGFRLALSAEHDLQSGVTLWLSPWYEYWELSASPQVKLWQQGMPSDAPVFAREPDSETRNAGVLLGLRWRLR